MSNDPSGFDPFWMFRLPLSGAVNQRISAPWFSPSLTVNYAGDPAIEDRVVTEVASYGTQLGWLNEIVLALANKQAVPQDTLNSLAKAVQDIEAINKSSLPRWTRLTTHWINSSARMPTGTRACCANEDRKDRNSDRRKMIEHFPCTDARSNRDWPPWPT